MALKLSTGLLNFDEELSKFDLEKQEQIQEARTKMIVAGFIDGYKLTEKGQKALAYLTECEIST